MILIMILALILAVLLIVTVAFIGTIGAGAIIVFADVIVCALFIGWLIYKLSKKKKG